MVAEAVLFAVHATVAMAGARSLHQLQIAMDSRDVIGQAKGMLMERFKITADQAFGLLIKASAEAGIKVRDVAEVFAATGEGPRRPMGSGRR